jgi:hypothetical protein
MKIEVMDIRPARIEDIPRIAYVHVHSWQGAYLGLLPQDGCSILMLERVVSMRPGVGPPMEQ